MKNPLTLYTINLLTTFLSMTVVLDANNDYLKLFGLIMLATSTAFAVINAQKILGKL